LVAIFVSLSIYRNSSLPVQTLHLQSSSVQVRVLISRSRTEIEFAHVCERKPRLVFLLGPLCIDNGAAAASPCRSLAFSPCWTTQFKHTHRVSRGHHGGAILATPSLLSQERRSFSLSIGEATYRAFESITRGRVSDGGGGRGEEARVRERCAFGAQELAERRFHSPAATAVRGEMRVALKSRTCLKSRRAKREIADRLGSPRVPVPPSFLKAPSRDGVNAPPRAVSSPPVRSVLLCFFRNFFRDLNERML